MLDIDRLIAFVHFVIRNKPFFVWGNLNKLKGNRTPIELIYLWMPNVKNTGIGTADYFNIGSNIFTIQHHVLISPSMWKSFLISLTLQRFLFIIKLPNTLLIKPSNFEKIRSILASHSIAKITPKASVTWNHKLICFRWHFLSLQGVHHVWIIKTKNYRIINLRRIIH